MLMPKRVKHRRVHRGRMKGVATKGNTITYGSFGLVAQECGWITSNQIEAARIAMTRYIKRGGKVYINGEVLDEHYGNEEMLNPGIVEEPVTLGEDEYFVLGDNRNHSQDSRDPSVGAVHRKDLLGRAWIRIWPFDKFGVIKHE